MTAEALLAHTYLPPDEPDDLASVRSFLTAHEDVHHARPEPRYALVGADVQDRIELPAEVHAVLRQVVEALSANRAVTVSPRSRMLTTQQAADLLGVSRPTVVRLLDSGELPGERVGSRRRLRLQDVLDYQEVRRQRQYDALAAMPDYGDDDPEAVLADVKAARRAVAEQRKTQRGRR